MVQMMQIVTFPAPPASADANEEENAPEDSIAGNFARKKENNYELLK